MAHSAVNTGYCVSFSPSLGVYTNKLANFSLILPDRVLFVSKPNNRNQHLSPNTCIVKG